MVLDLAQMKSITLGAERIEKKEDGFHFSRFTQEQDALYQNRGQSAYIRSLASSGIQFRFTTNSRTLFLQTKILPGSGRSYFAFEIFVDGKRFDTLDNYDGKEMTGIYTNDVYPRGDFQKLFNLGAGEKEICVYFPWSARVVIKNFGLEDGAWFKPVKPEKTMLIFGDSITQGYDAAYPSNKYITRLAEKLGAQEYNKAIGGEIFFPELALTKESFVPDYVTVSYGTNDWSRCTKEEIMANCKAFFSNIALMYPESKVLVITPIWCKTDNMVKPVGKHEKMDGLIREIAKEFDSMTVVNGYELVPHEVKFFADGHLHPNDEGFDHYYENLVKELF